MPDFSTESLCKTVTVCVCTPAVVEDRHFHSSILNVQRYVSTYFSSVLQNFLVKHNVPAEYKFKRDLTNHSSTKVVMT